MGHSEGIRTNHFTARDFAWRSGPRLRPTKKIRPYRAPKRYPRFQLTGRVFTVVVLASLTIATIQIRSTTSNASSIHAIDQLLAAKLPVTPLNSSIVVGGIAKSNQSIADSKSALPVMHTLTNFAVDDVLQGNIPKSNITIRTETGQEGEIRFSVGNQPNFLTGSRSVVVLQAAPDGTYRLVNGNQGFSGQAAASTSTVATSSSYCPSGGTPGNGFCLIPQDGPLSVGMAIPYYYNPSGQTMNGVDQMVINAFHTWASVTPGGPNLVYSGNTSTRGGKGQNVIYWGDGSDCGGPNTGAAWLECTPWWSSQGHEIAFNIVINPKVQWTTARMQAALLHEVGHSLGLDHINDPNQIMYPLVSLSNPHTTLGGGDINGAKALYPNTPPPVPAITQSQAATPIPPTTASTPPPSKPTPPPLTNAAMGQKNTGRNPDGREQVFYVAPNGTIQTSAQTSETGSFGDWNSLGGSFVGDPTVASNLDGRLQVFGRGSNSQIYTTSQSSTNGNFNSWQQLGGCLISNPSVARNADGRLQVYAVGCDHNLYTILQAAVNGSTFSSWVNLGGNGAVTRDPAVGFNADGRLQVFVRFNDGSIRTGSQTAPGYGFIGFVSMNEFTNYNPTVLVTSGRLMALMVVGTDCHAYISGQIGFNDSFSAWYSTSDSNCFTGDISLTSNSDGRVQGFATGTDKALWTFWQTGVNNGSSGWISLGGCTSPSPTAGLNGVGLVMTFVRGCDSAVNDVFINSQTAANGGANHGQSQWKNYLAGNTPLSGSPPASTSTTSAAPATSAPYQAPTATPNSIACFLICM